MECVPLQTRPDVAAAITPGAPRPAPLLLTIPQAADLLAVSRSTVYRLIDDGRLETVHVRGIRRIRPAALQRCVDALEREARERAVRFQ